MWGLITMNLLLDQKGPSPKTPHSMRGELLANCDGPSSRVLILWWSRTGQVFPVQTVAIFGYVFSNFRFVLRPAFWFPFVLGGTLRQWLSFFADTLPKTNMVHEHGPLDKEIPTGNHHFWDLPLSFRGERFTWFHPLWQIPQPSTNHQQRTLPKPKKSQKRSSYWKSD